MTQFTVGVDISKDHLDAHRLSDGQDKRFANNARGRGALIKWANEGRVAFEATGAYHRDLEQALAKAGIDAIKINPWQVRRFAEAVGTRAKTDQVDARMLASMASALALKPTPPPSENLLNLKELRIARQALIKDRTATKNRSLNATMELIKRHNIALLQQLEQQLREIDQAIADLIKDDEELNERLQLLISIPGFSGVSAAAVLIEASELGSLGRAAAVSLTGVAPMSRQSGQWKGKARTQGGRASLRKALYMPALVAARHNPNFKAFYQRLISAGKPPKVAITALMRKLIVLADALLNQRRKWEPIAT